MNEKQTKEALCSLALERAEEYKERLAGLNPANKTEIKALKMLLNLTNICAGLGNCDNTVAVKEKQIRFLHVFDENLPYLDSLVGDDRDSFIIFAAAVSMVYSHFYAKPKALVEGKPTIGAEEAFEAKLKYDCIREILEKWIAWWGENGCVKCEVSL